MKRDQKGQGSLFAPQTTLRDILNARVPNPTDPTIHPEAKPRVINQSQQILERLRRGPATARELAGIALNYRARISDLRAIGHDIPQPVEDHATGESVYTLNQ